MPKPFFPALMSFQGSRLAIHLLLMQLMILALRRGTCCVAALEWAYPPRFGGVWPGSGAYIWRDSEFRIAVARGAFRWRPLGARADLCVRPLAWRDSYWTRTPRPPATIPCSAERRVLKNENNRVLTLVWLSHVVLLPVPSRFRHANGCTADRM